MKKNNLFKKSCSVLLASALVLGSLSGCGSNNKNDKNKTGGKDEDIPTYKIATVRWVDSWPIDFLHSGIMKELEKKHGIKIDWQVYYNSDWAEQKSLLLASGDLPDAFVGSICLNESDFAQNKANFLELTDLIDEKHMPNLTKAFKSAPELKAICTDRDGKIYSLPKKLPLRPKVCGNPLYINKVWLDNLGLEMPKTYKELEDVLEKFVKEDADKDGNPNNEIGFSNAASKALLSGDLRTILAPFGTMVSRANNYMGLDSNGKPVFMPIQENYKEAVKWMHGLWEKGILDREYFTQDDSMFASKKQAEGGSKVGLIHGWTADAEAGVNAPQFALLEAVEGYDGNHYIENAANFLNISDRELVISKKCKNPEKLLAWADDFYDNIASLQTFYGSIKDGCVTANKDGTYDVNTPKDGSSLDTSAWSNSLRDFGPKYMEPSFYDKIKIPDNQGDGIKLKEDEVNGKYVSDDKNVGFPMVQYTDEELQKLTTLGTDIYKYCEAQYAHWVVDGGIDKEWDAYVKQLNDMGVQELIKIQNNAYETYLKNMK